MPFVDLRTEALVPASPERVWEVLTDFKAFPEWNPLVLEARGVAEPGARVHLLVPHLASPGKTVRIPARIIRFEPGRELAWVGGVPGIFRGEHYWSLSPVQGGTRLQHGERLSGLVPRIWGRRKIEGFRAAYMAHNAALVARLGAP
jgi:hypothetical protein